MATLLVTYRLSDIVKSCAYVISLQRCGCVRDSSIQCLLQVLDVSGDLSRSRGPLVEELRCVFAANLLQLLCNFSDKRAVAGKRRCNLKDSFVCNNINTPTTRPNFGIKLPRCVLIRQ